MGIKLNRQQTFVSGAAVVVIVLIAIGVGAYYLSTKNNKDGVVTPSPHTTSANWINGLADTAMAGKYVYNTDLTQTYKWKTERTSCASPQCAVGLDPSYTSDYSLVSPQNNTNVDFSSYPAQSACKAIGGRLPNMQELLAIYNGKANYSDNFQTGDFTYWSATESDSSSAYNLYFGDDNNYRADNNGVYSAYKNVSTYFVRCVKD